MISKEAISNMQANSNQNLNENSLEYSATMHLIKVLQNRKGEGYWHCRK